MSDIVINRILVRGDNVQNSELEFTRGVNLITGGSDTGKTYAFELIDYVFGSSEIPNFIEERKGYSDVYLEISVNEITHTFFRTFSEPDIIKLCMKKIDSIDEKVQFKEYRVSSQAKNSISKFLMEKLGYNDKLYFRKNKTNKTDLQQMTFRSYVKNFMISEEKITAKSKSIIETELTYPKPAFTKEKLIFFLTKTGNKEKLKRKKTDFKAANKLEIIEEILAENEKALKKAQEKYNKSKSEIVDEIDINVVQEQIEKLESEIEKTKNAKEELLDEIKSNDNDKITIDSTIKRFEVLSEQYKIEMDRLDFLYKAESYLSQIKQAMCPVCDRDIEESNRDLDEIYIAFNAEKNKLVIKSLDIEETIQGLEYDKEVIIAHNKDLDELLIQTKSYINDNLIPKLNNLTFYYSNVMRIKELDIKQRVYQEENTKLRDKIKTLNMMINSEKKGEETISDNTIFINRRTELCKKIAKMLEKFKFAESVEVAYDEDELDFIVNDQKRKAYGQGYSSLIYIAYVLSLKKIMEKYNVATPNFVIFDSPFTSLTEGDEIKEKKIQVSRKIVDAFFEYCCEAYKDKQLILFENSNEKYENINPNINYIHFTKNKSFGRYGFFEVAQKNIEEI